MNGKTFCLVLVLMLVVPASAFSQTDSLISIQTDSETYNEGDSVIISGQVSTVIPDTPITLKISTDGRLIEVGQIEVARDGSYSHIVIAEGSMWAKEGKYLAEAAYGEENVETQFSYFPKTERPQTTNIFEMDAGSSGTIDVEYTIQGGTVKNIQVNKENLALVITLDATDNGSLTLELPRSAIDAKKIERTDEEFIVLIDDSQITHQELVRGVETRTITVNFDEGDSEIWVIGTWVIPEFGTMATIVLAVTVTSIILLTKGAMRTRF